VVLGAADDGDIERRKAAIGQHPVSNDQEKRMASPDHPSLRVAETLIALIALGADCTWSFCTWSCFHLALIAFAI